MLAAAGQSHHPCRSWRWLQAVPPTQPPEPEQPDSHREYGEREEPEANLRIPGIADDAGHRPDRATEHPQPAMPVRVLIGAESRERHDADGQAEERLVGE